MYDEIIKDFDAVEDMDYYKKQDYAGYIKDSAIVCLVTSLYCSLYGEEHEEVYGRLPSVERVYEVLIYHTGLAHEEDKMRIYSSPHVLTATVLDYIDILYVEWLEDDYLNDYEGETENE